MAPQAWFRGPGWGHKHIVDVKEMDQELVRERGHELVMLPNCACGAEHFPALPLPATLPPGRLTVLVRRAQTTRRPTA